MLANAQLKPGHCSTAPACTYRSAKPPVSRCGMACSSRQYDLFQNAKQTFRNPLKVWLLARMPLMAVFDIKV